MSVEETFESMFRQERPRLERLAMRILGDPHLAEEAVQESWLKFVDHGAEGIDSVGAWLTTIVTRTSIDAVRRRHRRAGTIGVELEAPAISEEALAVVGDRGAEHAALAADAIGAALLVVLDRLSPLERVAFILHDVIGIPFGEIAALIERSPHAARQLASRARHRVRGDGGSAGGIARQRALAERFIAAAKGGDIAALLEILDPDVTLEMDAAAARMASSGRVKGAAEVSAFFSGRAAGAHVALIDGEIGLIVIRNDRLGLVVLAAFSSDRITSLRAIAEGPALDLLHIALPAAAPIDGRDLGN
jgi:RNA polymerase sigma-70 factor, ECF subfamily